MLVEVKLIEPVSGSKVIVVPSFSKLQFVVDNYSERHVKVNLQNSGITSISPDAKSNSHEGVPKE